MKYIKTPEGIRVNPACILQYEPAGSGCHIITATGNIDTAMSAEELDAIISESGQASLSKDSCDLIRQMMRHMDELRNAITRMPTSMRLHY